METTGSMKILVMYHYGSKAMFNVCYCAGVTTEYYCYRRKAMFNVCCYAGVTEC